MHPSGVDGPWLELEGKAIIKAELDQMKIKTTLKVPKLLLPQVGRILVLLGKDRLYQEREDSMVKVKQWIPGVDKFLAYWEKTADREHDWWIWGLDSNGDVHFRLISFIPDDIDTIVDLALEYPLAFSFLAPIETKLSKKSRFCA